MDRSDIEEMAKDLIPLAESTNAGEALMTTDYDDKWECIAISSGRIIPMDSCKAFGAFQ